MLAHGGLCQADVLNQVTHPMLTGSKVLQHGEPSGVPQRIEQMRIHAGSTFVQYHLVHIHRHAAMISPIGVTCL